MQPQSPLPREARYAAGKALRHATPRESHAELTLAPARYALAILAEGDRIRIPRLVPERYRRMAASPFAFFRGAAAVMAQDLATAPQAGVVVQACGDCHIGNFGVARSPEGNVLFDINDFDETLPGVDFTVDVKRLCASLALAVAENPDATPAEAREAALAAAHSYRMRMHALAERSPFEIWTLRTDIHTLIDHVDDTHLRDLIGGFVDKAGGDEDPRTYQKLDPANDARSPARWRIADKPPNIFHLPADEAGHGALQAEAVFTAYRDTLPPERRALVARYSLTDVVFKVVGVGSVGTFCALGLFTTPDGAPLFLQIKEAATSCLTRIAGHDAFPSHGGERVVQGQRMMQSAPDVFLGWTTEPGTGRQFYVRHLKNKHLGEIAPLIQGHALGPYGKLCGATLARSHARSGDAATIAGYMGQSEAFETALADLAMRYAEVTKGDWGRLEEKQQIERPG